MTDSTVRAMTWNIWWRFGPRWADRQPGIVGTLQRAGPDILALQEVWGTAGTTQADELAEQLGMYAVFAAPSYPPSPADEVGLGVALLSRWPILDQGTFVLPARHRSWDPVSITARVDHPSGPLPIIATCLDYGVPYTDDRIAQARLLADRATDPEFDGPCPVLVMGDMNAASDSAVLRSVRDVLIDAWIAGGGDSNAITLPSTHPSAPLEAGPEMVDQRIDHIFYRPGREDQHVIVEGIRIVGDPVDGVYPSDHRAVIADLRWRG
jgi:endonuclease/exonuclease/phosphatase family metal-dependent hydrolase